MVEKMIKGKMGKTTKTVETAEMVATIETDEMDAMIGTDEMVVTIGAESQIRHHRLRCKATSFVWLFVVPAN
jgi:hypothetical protein